MLALKGILDRVLDPGTVVGVVTLWPSWRIGKAASAVVNLAGKGLTRWMKSPGEAAARIPEPIQEAAVGTEIVADHLAATEPSTSEIASVRRSASARENASATRHPAGIAAGAVTEGAAIESTSDTRKTGMPQDTMTTVVRSIAAGATMARATRMALGVVVAGGEARVQRDRLVG